MAISLARRSLLASTVGIATGGIVANAAASAATVSRAPTPHPDAEILAVCAEFIACNRAYCSLYDGPDFVEDEDEAYRLGQPYILRQIVLLDRMRELHATTAMGIAARAQALAEHSGHWDFGFEDRETVTGRLLDYLMRDAISASELGRSA